MAAGKKIAFLYVKNFTMSLSEHVLIDALARARFSDIDLVDVSVLLYSGNVHLYEVIKEQILSAQCLYLSNYVARFMHYDIDAPISKIISRKIDSVGYLRLLLEEIYASDRVVIATTCCLDPMDESLINYINCYCREGATRYLKGSPSDIENAQESFPCDFEKLRQVCSKLESLKVDIELHHCVGAHELISTQNYRFRKAVVPGAGYIRRRRAIESLPRLLRLFTPKSYLARSALTLANKAYDVTKDSSYIRHAYNFANSCHRIMLGTSAMVYTDGSKLDLPVRKFFEIPAAGCLLLCTPFTGMSDLGFKDGVTHIECAPEDFGKVIRNLDFRSPAVREIIRNGQELIREKHSADAQAIQLAEALRRTAAGTLKSARWLEGQYVYE